MQPGVVISDKLHYALVYAIIVAQCNRVVNSWIVKRGVFLRSTWIDTPTMRLILGAMMPENCLALEVSEATGLRISDVLSIKTDSVRQSARPTVQDSKTGKRHRIYIPVKLRARMLAQAGRVYVWPSRTKPLEQHRSRQAVYKDMRKAIAVFRRNGRIEADSHPSPHSARKRAAVRAYHHGGLDEAARLLMHDRDDAVVTMLYALSDQTKGVRCRGPKSKSAKGSRAGRK